MILRLPGLIAKLAGLVGTKHRNHLLVEVNTLDDVLAINEKVYAAWYKYQDDTRRHSIKASLTAARHRLHVAEVLFTQEQGDGS